MIRGTARVAVAVAVAIVQSPEFINIKQRISKIMFTGFKYQNYQLASLRRSTRSRTQHAKSTDVENQVW